MRPALACAAVLLLAACRGPAHERPVGELPLDGRPVEAKLDAGEPHRYRLPLQKGFLLRLVLDQQGIDAVVALEDPTGVRVLEADRPINDRGPELVLAVAERTGDYSLVVRGWEGSGPGRYAARVEALRPASAADRRSAEAYRLFTRAEGQKADEAMKSRQQALATWQELGEVALAAEALDSLGRMYKDRQPQVAAERYGAAVAAFARAGDRRREAIARTHLGATLLDLGELQRAAEQYSLALRWARRERDLLTEGRAQNGLGQALQGQGELQRALDHYQEALRLLPQGDPMRPHAQHQLGVLYVRYLHKESSGAKLLRQALAAWGPQLKWKATTLSQLGRLSYEQGRLDDARRFFEEALELQGEGDPCGRASVLMRLALVEEARGARPEGDASRTEALRIVKAASCPKSEATVHLLAAVLAEKRRDPAAARAGYRHCEQLFTDLGDRMGQAESLAGIARNARSLGDGQAALEANRRALDILEGVRPTVLSEDLRTSFFSGARQVFDSQIELLREMGAEEEAWAAAEEARARVLRDLLAESGAGLGRDVAPGLAEQERRLQRQLNVLELRRLETPDAQAEKLQALRQEIDACIADLEALRGKIRRQSPRYTSPARPGPVTLAATRRALLDDDTVLLEYHLGETGSTVWAVTRDAFVAASLPPRPEIERLAREAAGRMQSIEWWGRRNPRVLCDLSRMLLGPVAPSLGHRRLVVVADGALEALAFAALPVPVDSAACPAAPALVEGHEIVSLPSVAALLTQRRVLGERQPAPGWLAVVADPAYRSADRRLPGLRQEAEDITAGLPQDKVRVVTGADASRQTVQGNALRGFRIVHFAVHGSLDPEQPLLSALDLADLEPADLAVHGKLRAHEIYDLDLPAELVVLSACDTGGGREVAGEGLISGLPRAFLYAGASRVVVSLWTVEDRSTRDLMTRFYRGLFVQGLSPARALQEAQRAMRREGRRPYQWAGFVLLGDWRPLPPFSR